MRNCMKAEHPLTPGGRRLLFYGDWLDKIEDLGQLLGFEVVNDMVCCVRARGAAHDS